MKGDAEFLVYSFDLLRKHTEIENLRNKLLKQGSVDDEKYNEILGLLNAWKQQMQVHLEKNFPLDKIRVNPGAQQINVEGDIFYRTKGAGANNSGIFINEAGNKITKVIDGSSASSLREIFFALHAESVNGPKLYKVARVDQKKYILVMEKVFHEQDAIPMKEFLSKRATANARRFKASLNEDFDQNLINSLSDFYVQLVEKRIIPRDTDFIVTKSGIVRPIDVGFWSLTDDRKNQIRQFDFYIRGILAKLYSPEIDKKIFSEIFRKLKSSNKISKEELLKLKNFYEQECPCTLVDVTKLI